MSDNDFTIEQDTDTDLVRQLRRVIKDKDKVLAALETEVSTFKAEKRTSAVDSALSVIKDEKARAKVKALLPDAADSAEAVNAWLDEYADVFNIQRGDAGAQNVAEATGNAAETTAPGTAVPEEVQAAFQAVQRTEGPGGIVPFLGAEKTRALLNDVAGKGSDTALDALRAAGLVG